jgi:acyl-CoA synthetase (AMP-forming)/AMP-acid ligase II
MRLHDSLDHYTRERPNDEFATTGTRHWTQADASDEVNRLAGALVDLGLSHGDSVSILSKNSLEFIALYYAASKAGLIVAPLNVRLTPSDWAGILADADTRVLLVGPEFVDIIEGIRGDLGTVEKLIAIGPEAPAGWLSYRTLLDAQAATAPDVATGPEDVLMLVYTSGATGVPKGVPLSHRNILADFVQVALSMQSQPGDRWLAVAPLFHVGGAISNVLFPLYLGSSVYLMTDFIPPEVVRVMDEERIAVVLMVPAMIQACLMAVPDVAERKYADLRQLVYGASPCPEATLRRGMQVFGCDFYHGYGMTECATGVSRLGPDEHKRALDDKPEWLRSVGRPFMGTDVRICDPDGRVLPAGELGEIEIRGPQVTRGYWKRPEETASGFRDGWLRSGDAGRIDAEGYLYIEDRVKDMIITGGENVYPIEIETVLRQHPAVADVAVIGVPDERWGEAVKAVVVLKPNAAAADAELMEFCRGRIAGYKRPRSVAFVDALPRTALGKVAKGALRQQ